MDICKKNIIIPKRIKKETDSLNIDVPIKMGNARRR